MLLRFISEHAEIININRDERCCVNCTHFHQHYVRSGGNKFIAISHGHCDYPRLKDRSAAASCSKYFEQKEL